MTLIGSFARLMAVVASMIAKTERGWSGTSIRLQQPILPCHAHSAVVPFFSSNDPADASESPS
jgi:hypothetical protein